jgi:PAS domain S-box-containing protein
VEANDTPSKRSNASLFAVLLAAAAVILILFGFSQRRKGKAARTSDSRPERIASRLEATDGPALVIDAGATVVAANGAAVLLLDYPREELLGRSLRDIVAAEVFPAAEANVALALRGHEVGFEVVLTAKDGRRIEGDAKAAPLDPAEAALGACVSFREAVSRPAEPDADAVSATPPDR